MTNKETQLHVTIASVGEQLFDDVAKSIIAPGTEGQMQILANHEPLISTLKTGLAIVEKIDGEKEEFKIDGGILEVSDNQATILVS